MVKKIPLTQNQYAIVDDELFDYLNQWSWYAIYNKNLDGYYATTRKVEKGKIVLMHRFITNAPKGMVVDHINNNPLDNRLSNLRVVSHRQNLQNQKRRKNGRTSSKYPGVSWDKSKKRWKVSTHNNKKTIRIGCFKNEHEAAIAYEQFIRKHFDEELVCKIKKDTPT